MSWKFPDYSKNWDEIRHYVYKRDNYSCQVKGCNQKGGPYGNTVLHCAHKISKSKGGSDDPSNLETRCEDCHIEEHETLLNDPVKRERFVKSMVKRGKLAVLEKVVNKYLSHFSGNARKKRLDSFKALYSKYTKCSTANYNSG